MDFGTIRDSHLTIDLAGAVGPTGSNLMLVGLIAAGMAGMVLLALLVRALFRLSR